MIPTKRIWAAKPFLVAYVVLIGFVIGLLVNRAPASERGLPVLASGSGTRQHGSDSTEREAKEPPLWRQLFSPSQPTARLMLRIAIPLLAVVDGTASRAENRNLFVHWTGKGEVGRKPETFFQAMLPFLRPEPQVVVESDPPAPPPEQNPSVPPAKTGTGKDQGAREPGTSDSAAQVVNGGLPLVGIYHTHDWESYISEFPDGFVKQKEDLNKVVSYDHAKKTIVMLGNRLAVELRDQGVTTVHAPWKHQDLGYDYAYRSSRNTAKRILRDFPTAKILLDLHRDGVWDMDTRVMAGGQSAAKLRCIIGSYEQSGWEENKAFCDQLSSRLEAAYPGLTLPTRVQNDTYNQDLMPGAILLEIGGATNTYAEAERSVVILARVLAQMIRAGEYPS